MGQAQQLGLPDCMSPAWLCMHRGESCRRLAACSDQGVCPYLRLLFLFLQGAKAADAKQESIILSINDPEANAAGLVR